MSTTTTEDSHKSKSEVIMDDLNNMAKEPFPPENVRSQVNLAASERCIIKTNQDAQAIAAHLMANKAGSFFQHIGAAYAYGDASNRAKLVDAFADDFVRYAKDAGAFPTSDEGGAS
jgi:hypothetical protein